MTNTNIGKVLKMTSQGVGKWRKENRPIINLIEKYFDKDNIEEFLESGKIDKFEKLNFLYDNVIEKNERLYLDSFTKNFHYGNLSRSHTIFIDFYFSFLLELKEKENLIKYEFNDLLNSFLHSYLLNKYSKTVSDDESINKLIEIEKKFCEDEGIEVPYLLGETVTEEITNKTIKDCIIKTIKDLNNNDLNDIQKHIHSFELWNNDMLMYLDYVLKDDLQVFLDSKDKELIYHALGLIVYSNLKNELPFVKLELISSLKRTFSESKEEVTISKIENYIKKYKDHIIERVQNSNEPRKYDIHYIG